MAGEEALNDAMSLAGERQTTIRFAHIDGAAIVFYPRYIELIGAIFPELPLDTTPFQLDQTFRKTNRLGDCLTMQCEGRTGGSDWSVSGSVDGAECFSVRCAALERPAVAEQQDAFAGSSFEAASFRIHPYAVDRNGRFHLSRYFESVNEAVERWFEGTLGMPFSQLQSVRRDGIPTVSLQTRAYELPRLGDDVQMRVRPIHLGRRSLAIKSRLMRGNGCLLETEQVLVFIKLQAGEYASADVPSSLRPRIERQMSAAGE